MYFRKIISIRAEDSPNVRLALAQRDRGMTPTGEEVLPGVLSWEEYQERRATWDAVRQCVGLDAQFWEGADLLLFPPEWLANCKRLGATLPLNRKAKALGCDPGEGAANTAWCVGDESGVIDLISKKTPDTNEIPYETIKIGQRYGIPSDMWVLDRGGGGKQHADRIRALGHKGVRTIAFGEAISLDPRRGMNPLYARKDVKEERYAYFNRRAQMYGDLSEVCSPSSEGGGFAIPERFTALFDQLAPIPKIYDKEGRMRMLPKNNPDNEEDERTLVKIIGHSPDEADALVLMLHACLHRGVRVIAGAV